MSVLPVGFGSQGGGYTIEESLRFNASQSSYLSWTPASAGNRKTWTWSGWVKRGTLGVERSIFSVGATGANFALFFHSSDQLRLWTNGGNASIYTNAVYRDPSAWYHIVLQSSNVSPYIKLYVNGEEITSFSYDNRATYPSTNNTEVNSVDVHRIGGWYNGGIQTFDGYLTEVNFIDGQALDPSSFGEFDSVTGVWKPVGYTGTYGTNGFYLPMKLDNTVEGFNTVTYIGTGSKQKISGVGFSPDLIWMKSRTSAVSHVLIDSVRGVKGALSSNNTAAEYTESTNNGVLSFDTDGFTVGNDGNYTSYNSSGQSIVAWCWDAGDTTVSNTDGSITSSVRANPTYGFSVVSYTGTGSNATVGHGLGVAPKMIIAKSRSIAGAQWPVYTSETGASAFLNLDSTASVVTGNTSVWQGVNPTSTVFSVSTSNQANGSTATYIAYCFSEVSGYSKFGSYTGTGAAGNAVTTGFKPAMVMVKNTSRIENWVILDTTRKTSDPNNAYLNLNASDSEVFSSAAIKVSFTDTGFTLASTGDAVNRLNDTYIYMAFKDTREYAFWLDDSGNNNDWQPNGGITTESTVTDTPTPYADGGNYAVLNPVAKVASGSTSNANLKFTSSASVDGNILATIGVSSGKWYWEVICDSYTISNAYVIGIATPNIDIEDYLARTSGWTYESFDGYKANNNIRSAYGSTYTTGDIIGVAFDADAGSLTFYKNNVSQGVAFTGITGNTYLPAIGDGSNSGVMTCSANFGQRPFAYTPPTGFLPLHTGNLPDSTIADGSQYFDVVTRTGTGAEATVTGLQFQPDLLWTKTRSNAVNHSLTSTGLTYNYSFLQTNTTEPENTSASQYYMIPTSDGYTVGTGDNINQVSRTFVDWVWKANGAGVSNTDGSITSTVSANPTAGFSVVTWSGNATSGATIGHGLGSAPKMIIAKVRNSGGTYDWYVYHASLGNSAILYLNLSLASGSGSTIWGSTDPTSSVFSVGSNTGINGSGLNFVAYCFAEVEGYSKFGSYTGNGSADGPFVYTGFRPAFVLVKSTTNTWNWMMLDTSRNQTNVTNFSLAPNSSASETSGSALDILSNGFKWRDSGGTPNQSGGNYIYMAFAENPFKNSLAR